jgi:hypothetical protein
MSRARTRKYGPRAAARVGEKVWETLMDIGLHLVTLCGVSQVSLLGLRETARATHLKKSASEESPTERNKRQRTRIL